MELVLTLLILCTNRGYLANSEDLDEMLHTAAFDEDLGEMLYMYAAFYQDLHCLQR